MRYIVADIHGCYEEYRELLRKINFSANDRLYAVGDVVDRGPAGIKVLLDIADRNNVILFRGNHDRTAAFFLSNLHMLDGPESTKRLSSSFKMWLSDGGNVTMNEFLQLSKDDRDKALDVLSNSLVSKELVVNSQKYLLAHTVPEIERLDDYDEWTVDDFVMGEPDYEQVYFEDKIIITGHTPTSFIDVTYKGKIWKENNHIAIDCGAVFGNPLGCLCLDTMEEFYVED